MQCSYPSFDVAAAFESSSNNTFSTKQKSEDVSFGRRARLKRCMLSEDMQLEGTTGDCLKPHTGETFKREDSTRVGPVILVVEQDGARLASLHMCNMPASRIMNPWSPPWRRAYRRSYCTCANDLARARSLEADHQDSPVFDYWSARTRELGSGALQGKALLITRDWEL